jgi:ADP-ribosylglycohydrolase
MLGAIIGDIIGSVHEGTGTNRFDETCQGTVPQALTAFLESKSYEDAIRNSISLGGDADTLACITGGIAEAFYGGVPPDLAEAAKRLLDAKLAGVIRRFRSRFGLAAKNPTVFDQ